ncbi:MAG: helix-turn-helix transcriptional regulator [Rhodospirillales bacterium]|nr:helix-turn-helix transcriptional regulator [Rhodospirillales bacterium]
MSKKRENEGPNLTVALTEREKECLILVAQGKGSKEVGRALGVTTSCVNFHVLNVQRKLMAINRTHAVARAIALRLIPSDSAE